jgi:hypothetical protein
LSLAERFSCHPFQPFTTFENKLKRPVCMHLQVIDSLAEDRYLELA